MTLRLALTGGTGFIGRHLLDHLLAAGHRVAVLARRPPENRFGPGAAFREAVTCDVADRRSRPDPEAEAGGGLTWVRGSLSDDAALGRLVHDADAVIHLAGLVKAARQRHFHETNRDGVARLAKAAAAEAGNRRIRFVLVSSLAAARPELSAYAASKRAGEEALAASGSGLERLVVRPPVVYGEGDLALLPFFRAVRRGIVPLAGRNESRLSMIHVSDLSRAILRAVEAAIEDGTKMTLDDGAEGGYTIRRLGEVAASHLNVDPVFLKIPRSAFALLGGVNDLRSWITGKPFILTGGKVKELFYPDWVCNNREASRTLGWYPSVTVEQGFGGVIRWYRAQGML